MPPAADSNAIKLVGFKNFQQYNPRTDRFDVHKFHHVEFYCTDATNASRRFAWGLGMSQVGKSDQSTGNHVSASYVIQSGEVKLVFTAPYALETHKAPEAVSSLPGYDPEFAQKFVLKHGLAVRAVGIRVGDAQVAYELSVQNGGVGVQKPHTLTDKTSGKSTTISEVQLYGDVVIRWISGDFDGGFVPGYETCACPDASIGIQRLDHCVGNVPKLLDAVNMVLASNNEMVLLPINEPTYGTKRKSQIQTYLEQNVGAGLQHMALKTNDIFYTLAEIRKRSHLGGFEFMPKPNKVYYEQMPERIGDTLTKEQYKQIEQLGLLVDKDEQGILLQIFTKPLGDRATVFFEIIERVGCMRDVAGRLEQAAGCGGFGKGNFTALFKSIEEYEKSLNV
uniref:4-hydroxyphenylpyruvate dioxygenase n=1 Tax=Hyaloperonospora arabidopsidis (strain Emoy2) TaxID=559515 RepID=M4BWQ0_HYAAE